MSTLYVVATPIGNLEDVTLRAIRVLHEVGLIAAEDTRRTKRLLCAHQIKTPLTSYHEHNKRAKLPYLLRALEHGDVALISEAGMPGINDPGYDLVLAAIDRDVKVVPVPGPSAIPTALAVSGLTTEQFIHLGFLPRKKGARRKLLQSIAAEPRTIVAFETPHRLRSALVDLGEVLGERRLAICREMTKLHEEIFRGTVSQAIEHFAKPRGEFTLVIEGKAREPRCADRPRLDGFERGKYNRD
ncbi:16S rRNA (cytidine(1402)-2'-O)-methyltransferase [Dehalococcoidia bacterium]|nr:16S rRNA (cytidine(1402)-2'-O)-methyltransferase [Dehalococcoidia bacterium]MCL0103429.1 16S rRNA (cytidine(1402)-2'-O)-methyltransferase [Dehalococcoidia bacterium]